LSGNASFTQAQRQQKQTESMTEKSRFHQTQANTSTDDEPEDTYANEPLPDESWLAQYEAERQKEISTIFWGSMHFKNWTGLSCSSGCFKVAEHSFQELCLIHHYFLAIYALAPVFCKSKG